MPDAKLTWPKSIKQVTPQDVAAMGEKLGLAFPDDYARFLATVNGGTPSKKKFVTSAGGVSAITSFYALSEVALETRHFRSELELPADLIPIALAGEDIVLLENGKVVLWCLIESGFDPDRVYPVADSFDQFLEMLQTKVAKK